MSRTCGRAPHESLIWGDTREGRVAECERQIGQVSLGGPVKRRGFHDS
jgi:hypothetical protein